MLSQRSSPILSQKINRLPLPFFQEELGKIHDFLAALRWKAFHDLLNGHLRSLRGADS
jgi:hypothetical protein